VLVQVARQIANQARGRGFESDRLNEHLSCILAGRVPAKKSRLLELINASLAAIVDRREELGELFARELYDPAATMLECTRRTLRQCARGWLSMAAVWSVRRSMHDRGS
jgi:hypothetical protein